MMQGIGAEVSQKIRSAIKAKLMELGAYVDEELPDYVMVMVGNKRSQSQMEDELQLFLGSSTVVFTTWLHQVLQKLQEVTVGTLDAKKDNSSVSKRKGSESDSSKKKKKSKLPAEVSDKKHDKRSEKTEISKTDSSNKCEKIESSKSDFVNKHEKNESSKSESTNKYKKTDLPKSDNLNSDEHHSLSHEQEKCLSKTYPTSPRKDECKEESPPMAEQSLNNSENDKSHKDSVDSVMPSSCKTEKQALLSKEKTSEDSVTIPEDIKQTDNLHTVGKRERSPSQADDDDFINIKAEEDLMGSDLIEEANPKISTENKKHSYDSGTHRKFSEENTSKRQTSDQSVAKKSTEKLLDARELLNRKKAARLADTEDSRPIPVISSNRRSRGISPGHKDYRYSCDDRPSRRVVSTKTERPLYHKFHGYQDERSAKRYSAEDSSSTSRVVKSANTRRRDADEKFIRQPVTLDRSRFNKEEWSSRTHYSKVISISQTLRVEREVTRGRKVVEEDKSSAGGLSRSVSRQLKSDEEDVDITVPSVVKVTPRPKRPLSQQANHTLILKAVADANKSLASAPPRPDITQKKKDARPASLFIRTLKDMIRQEKIAISISNNNIHHKDEENKPEIDINLSEDCEDELLGMSADNSSQGSTTHLVTKGGVVSEQGEDANSELVTSVQKWLNDVDEAECDRLVNDHRAVSNHIEDGNLQTADHAQIKETDTGPQFVVTLNGLDPTMFLQEQEDYEADLLQWESTTEDQENKDMFQHRENDNDTDREITPPLSPQAKKRRCSSPIIIVSKSSSQKSTEDILDGGKTKILERCKYWPSCRSGDNCNYHHPSVACKMFPACKFGDHCLFIHPQCKFNTACTRRDCAYSHTHSSVLTPIQPLAVSKGKSVNSSNIPLCRFYPKCANINCQFYHPKPCRFGHYCTKKDCTFDHSDPMPPVDKLKWTRPQT